MHTIVKFSGRLRENGIPASIRSTRMAYETFQIFKDSPYLKDALKAVYMKDNRHQDTFNQIFDELFGISKNNLVKEEYRDRGSLPESLTVNKNQGSAEYNPSSRELQDSSQGEIQHVKDEINYNPPVEDYSGIDLDEKALLERDINALDFFEPELFELCQKLGRKIANRRAMRFKTSKKNRIDIRRSIRKNLKYGGALIDLVKSKPPLKKSQHFFLSDVSGSCDWISNWFFCMLYASQKSFYRTRCFDFDHKVVENTEALQENNLMEAFARVRDIRQKNIMFHGTSNMYTAFQDFIKKINFNYKSSIIILSDCRDWAGPKEDGRPMSADSIEYMAKNSKRVLILNPEPKIKWDVVDSCVSDYRDAGAHITEVRNLYQLSQLIEWI